MADETRIIKIEVDQTQALKDLEATESALIDLKEQQKQLNESLKAGTITQQEYVASKVQLDQKITQETANRKTLTQAINTESNSLGAQKLKLKDLIAERDKIDRSTVEGAKKFDQMNGSINQLSGSIKKAEEQGGSFQRNVGNYKGTIDQFTGGAYSAAQGLASMTTQALKFIATPLGLIIAAIALAIGSLVAYFKSSEEGQDRWNKIVTVGKVILEKFMDIVEGFGQIVYDAFATAVEWVGKFASVLGISETAIGGVVDEAVKAGARMSALQAQLDKQERESLVNNAKKRLEVSELRRKADEAEGDNKLRYLNEALELERQIIDEDVANAELRAEIARSNVDIYGADKENLKAQAEAEAAVFAAKSAQFEETRKMNKERIATEKQIEETLLKRIDADKALEQQETDRVAKANIKADEELGKALDRINEKEAANEESMQINMDWVDAEAEAEQKASDETWENYKQNEEKKREEAERTRAATIAAVMQASSFTADTIMEVARLRAADAKNQIDVIKNQYDQEIKALEEKFDKGEITEQEFKDAKDQLEKDSANKINEIRKKVFEDNKKAQIATAIINTVQSGIMAFAQLGPIAGAIAAAIVLALGYKQVDVIRDQQFTPGGFSIGGYTGPGGVHDPAGIVHRGEVVWNQSDVAAVGGPMAANRMRPTFNGYAMGGIVSGMMSNSIDGNMGVPSQFPAVKLSLTDLHSAENAHAIKVQITEA